MKNKFKNKNIWPIKIGIITFCLAIVFSYLSQMAANCSDIFIPLMILVFMVFLAIITDGIAVAVTSCDEYRLKMYRNNDIVVYNIALSLVKKAEKVNNICANVIGDMCGILSGACGATLIAASGTTYNYLDAICVSSMIVALTVGGKAYLKDLAVNSSEEFILSVAKILKLFIRTKNENIKHN